MQRFKTPIIASAAILVLTLIAGLAAITVIYNSDGTNGQKAERAGMVGSGIATAGCVAIAHFWLYAAAKIGQEKRRKSK